MKILVVADEESKYLWDYYDEKVFKDVDFIISAGDVKAKYLSFLTTMTGKRVLYVPGNHDRSYTKEPPYGCDCLDDVIIYHHGLRIVGLGGSYRYNQGPYQYSEKQMQQRIRRLKVMIQQFGGVDILVAHAPALGHNDGEDLCHRGFDAFNKFIKSYKPSYFLHGHQHLTYSHSISRVSSIDSTVVINGYNYHFFDYQDNHDSPKPLKGMAKVLNSILFFFKYFKTPVFKDYRRFRKDQKANASH